MWVLVLVSCGEAKSGSADGGPVVCPESGLEPQAKCPPGTCVNGPACEPIFDDCGDNEISVMGGGCQRVGLPPDCWDGWLPTGDGGCEPILPAGDCSFGTMPIIGETECQPIRECGTGKWGLIDIQPGAVFVDRSYDDSSVPSNGTELRPFRTIQDAINAPQTDGQVVVAAGDYFGDVDVDKRLTLDGRCPPMTTIHGVSTFRPALAVFTPGATVRGFAVTGPSWGIISPAGALDVTLEQLHVRDTGFSGVMFQDGAGGILRHAIVATATYAGVSAITDATVTVEDVAVSNILPASEGYGRGVWAEDRSSLVLRRVIVTGSPDANLGLVQSAAEVEEAVILGKLDGGIGAGIIVEDSDLTLERSLIAENRIRGIDIYGISGSSVVNADQILVRDSLSDAKGANGMGIQVGSSGSVLRITRSLLFRNRTMGLWVEGGSAEVEDVVIAGTLGLEAGGAKGHGAQFGVNAAEVTVSRSLFAANHAAGMLVVGGATVTIQDVTVRDTQPTEADGRLGVGIHTGAYPPTETGTPATLEVRNSLLEGNHAGGLVIVDSNALVEYVTVRSTWPALGGDYGDGVVVVHYPDRPLGVAALDGLLVEDSPRAGVGFWAMDGTLRRSVIRRGTFGVVLADGADPELEDNLFEDNECNDVCYEDLERRVQERHIECRRWSGCLSGERA